MTDKKKEYFRMLYNALPDAFKWATHGTAMYIDSAGYDLDFALKRQKELECEGLNWPFSRIQAFYELAVKSGVIVESVNDEAISHYPGL